MFTIVGRYSLVVVAFSLIAICTASCADFFARVCYDHGGWYTDGRCYYPTSKSITPGDCLSRGGKVSGNRCFLP